MRRVGPYGGIVTADDARQMVADGFRLAVVSGIGADVSAVLQGAGAKYIDTRLWGLIFEVCRRQYDVESAAGRPLACVLSASDENAITTEASNYLRRAERDPALAAFWILDDDPRGDVTGMLRRLRDLVHESNARSAFARPTVCGVGGLLDHKRSPNDSSFAPDRLYMVHALRNVSPAGCDLVAPYFYGAATVEDPSLIDWSMRDLLPYFQEALKAKGYESARDVMMPLAHAFSSRPQGDSSHFVKPRAADVEAQMRAYCESGAASVLFFTWRSQDAEFSYANDSGLRDGVQRGKADCNRQWRGDLNEPR